VLLELLIKVLQAVHLLAITQVAVAVALVRLVMQIQVLQSLVLVVQV
jgi:hypothetical protein